MPAHNVSLWNERSGLGKRGQEGKPTSTLAAPDTVSQPLSAHEHQLAIQHPFAPPEPPHIRSPTTTAVTHSV
ncbi:hypothetical protein BST61_g9752 [Cercospora zeina]